MLIDEIHEQLKAMLPDVAIIKSYWANANIEQQYQALEAKTAHEDAWKTPELAKELQRLRSQKEEYEHIINSFTELQELVELFGADEAQLPKLADDVSALRGELRSFKLALLLHEPQDASPCFLTINAGAGGTESQDWANILLRMYTRFCERNRFSIDILDLQQGEEAGIKSATLFIKGKNAYGLLKSETWCPSFSAYISF